MLSYRLKYTEDNVKTYPTWFLSSCLLNASAAGSFFESLKDRNRNRLFSRRLADRYLQKLGFDVFFQRSSSWLRKRTTVMVEREEEARGVAAKKGKKGDAGRRGIETNHPWDGLSHSRLPVSTLLGLRALLLLISCGG